MHTCIPLSLITVPLLKNYTVIIVISRNYFQLSVHSYKSVIRFNNKTC